MNIQLTKGQVFFVILSTLIAGFAVFYCGARFGPELFWHIRIDRLSKAQLLPDEPSQEELEALMARQKPVDFSYREVLEKKTPAPKAKAEPRQAPAKKIQNAKDESEVAHEDGEELKKILKANQRDE